MKIEQVAKIGGGQDGAIFGQELFRFDERGNCRVYNIADINGESAEELVPTAHFTLDRSEKITPHSNAVTFGTERYLPDDELPLLYTNIYNNYSAADDKMIGVCCVYRIMRTDGGFDTELVQIIKIGFTTDTSLWRAYPDRDGARPYGNFVIDRDANALYTFVMRSEELGTAYFKFPLPRACDGVTDERCGVRTVTLNAENISDTFTCPYHRYIQGATVWSGKLYSAEGFSSDEINRPAIRIIDLKDKKQERYIDLTEYGCSEEPEMIDFYGGVCYYSDVYGRLYKLSFD